MNSLSYTLFLGLFLSFSLGLYLISQALEKFKLTAAHKLVVLKTGLLFLALAPFVFLALEAITYKSIEIKMPSLYIDPAVAAPTLLPPMQQKVYWPLYVSLAYGIGVAIVVLGFVRNYYLTRRWLEDSVSATLQGQAVQLSSRITSPLSFGFFSPQIYFPQSAQESWTSREIQLALSHEQNHLLRQDPLWKLVSLFVRSLLFFAPWMYSLHKKLELEMEILCDETTCLQTQASHEEYGTLLLRLVCQFEAKNILVTNITDSTIKRRILAMKSRKIHRPVLTTILSFCLMLIGTTTIAAVSGVIEKKSVFHINSEMYLNGRLVSKPRLVTEGNSKASISQINDDGSGEFFFELVANDVSMPSLKDGIGINFNIRYHFGSTNHVSNPQVILKPNQPGSITVSDESGQILELRIIATRE